MLHTLTVQPEGLLLLDVSFCIRICSELYHILMAVLNEYLSKTDQHERSDMQLLEVA